MKRLSPSQQVSVMRGLNRVGERELSDAVAAGFLFLAESQAEADQVNCMHLQLGDRNQFAFSLTPRGRAALDTNEGV